MSPATPARKGLSRTLAALFALATGLCLGIGLHGSADPTVERIVLGVGAIGQLWVSALRMIVLPLVVALTLSAIVGPKKDASVGRLGARTVALFVAMLLAGTILTLAIAGPAVALYPVDSQTAAAFRAGTSVPAPPAGPATGPTSLGEWLRTLVPTNVVESAARGDILPVLLFTVFFGLAVTRLAPEAHDRIRDLFQAISDAMMVLVGWVLRFLPLGVFALCLEFGFRVGVGVTGVIAAFVVLVSAMSLLLTILLYPATAVLGRTSLSSFARAAAPAQVVAVSTRSSLASLPALIEGGRRHLRLPDTATGFVLPLSVATFKLNRAVSAPLRLLFLAHVFQIHLSVPQVAAFVATNLILSFSTLGIPSMGAIRSIPAYVAAGIPLEGVLMLNAVDTIPDIFYTLTNVTGDMSAAAILSRGDRVPAPAAEGEPA